MFDKPTRNHITYIIERLGAVGLVLLTGSVSILFELFIKQGHTVTLKMIFESAADGDMGAIIPAASVVIIAAVTLWLFFRWRKTVFYIDGEYLAVEKNTLMKRTSRLPVSGISTVNLERNLFERLVGTAKVKLDINSAATANRTDFEFVLSLKKAKAFEAELMSRKAAFVGSEPSVQRETVCSFTAGEALRDTLLGQSPAWLITAAGVVLVNAFVGENLFYLIAVFVLSFAFRLVTRFMNVCGFIMEKDESCFYISSGLVKKKNYSFEKDKVNALIVRRPFLARLFGLYRAEVAVVGLGNDEHETPQICLLVKKSELERILRICAPDFICNSVPVKPSKVGFAAEFFSFLPVTVLLAVALGFVHPATSIGAVVFGAFLGVLSCKSKTICIDENIFSYSTGIFSVTQGYFKYSGIQTAHFISNAVFRRFGIGRIRISILSSSSVSVHTSGFFGKEYFETLVDKLGC